MTLKKQKKRGIFYAVLCIAFFSVACTGVQIENNAAQMKNIAVIEMEGNPTTGYSWVYKMSPENIIREVSNTYIADQTQNNRVGSGGKFVFTFEAVTRGEAELVFSYLRPWEEGIPPVQTVTFNAIVDDNNNLTLSQF